MGIQNAPSPMPSMVVAVSVFERLQFSRKQRLDTHASGFKLSPSERNLNGEPIICGNSQ